MLNPSAQSVQNRQAVWNPHAGVATPADRAQARRRASTVLPVAATTYSVGGANDTNVSTVEIVPIFLRTFATIVALVSDDNVHDFMDPCPSLRMLKLTCNYYKDLRSGICVIDGGLVLLNQP